jgi:tight adherence protein B
MVIGIIFAFLVLFILVIGSATMGMRFWDTRRKKQVSEMLKTVSGEQVELPTGALLMEADGVNLSPMERVFADLDFGKKLNSMIQQAGLDWSSTKFLVSSLVCAVIGALLSIRFPVLISMGVSALAMACVFFLLPYFYVARTHSKRMAKLESQFPDALEFLSRSMRAGHAFTISLEMLGEELPEPLGQEFRTLFNEQNLGASMDVALQNMCQRVPLLDMRFFSSSVMLQKQTGGNLSEILTRLADVIRDRFRLKGQVKAASAHGRLTATILMCMPIATMFGLLLVAPGYLQGMAKDKDGQYLIGGAIFAQFLGNYFIRRIINIKV